VDQVTLPGGHAIKDLPITQRKMDGNLGGYLSIDNDGGSFQDTTAQMEYSITSAT
jgi:hypothetical protein